LLIAFFLHWLFYSYTHKQQGRLKQQFGGTDDPVETGRKGKMFNLFRDENCVFKRKLIVAVFA